MSRRRRAVVATSAALVVSVAAAGERLHADAALRHRIERTLRIWRLASRRATHFAVVRVRGIAADEERRRALDEQFAIRSAEDVARELGQMKGAVMKAGQMISFIADGLPEPAQQALASLQADVPPMAPSLAEEVVERELGLPPRRLFLDWQEVPVAAASIGQVHRAVLWDGREVAVKVQYPGVDTAIEGDMANAERLFAMLSSVTLKSLDTDSLVAELRHRMRDELDYRKEAVCQAEFAQRYRHHPFVRVPDVVPERSSRRVLTTEWVDGWRWQRFLDEGTEAAHQRAAEVLFRFVQGSIYEHGVFNGDPHPGNYLFTPEGSVTFLDFGLVKRWAPGELDSLEPLIDPLLAGDAAGVVARMVEVGFMGADHGLDPQHLWEYASRPYVPYLTDRFRFTPDFTSKTIASLLDTRGPFADVMAKLQMPTSFVVLDRVVWGMSALLGRLRAENSWRDILAEYRSGAPPATEIGEAEWAWRGGPARRA